MIELIKNLFKSKKKKLILDIKKKHNKNISDYDINDYRRKHKKYPDLASDNDILMLILAEDIANVESSRTTSNYSSPHVTTSEYSISYKSPKSTRNDDYYSSSSSSSSSSYDSGSTAGGSSSSSDCGSSSSCD